MDTVILYPTSSKELPKSVGHPESYFAMRYMWLDCRGPLTISPTAVFGFGVKIITRSHDMTHGEFDVHVVDRPVQVDDGAQVYSFALLYNCHIKHHAVVACGAVVRNMTVEPWTMVEGNPARVTKCWNGERWIDWYDDCMSYDEENQRWRMILDWGLPDDE